MNEITVWLLVIFAFGTAAFLYGHFVLARDPDRDADEGRHDG